MPDLLRSADGDRTTMVFDEAIRGKTDRVLYKLVKPEPSAGEREGRPLAWKSRRALSGAWAAVGEVFCCTVGMLGSGDMVDLAQAGGWLMVPLALASVVALAICIERAWVLRRARIVPPGLVADIAGAVGADDEAQAKSLCTASALGRVLLAGFDSASRGRDSMREAMEDAAGAVVHDLERYLTALGTIAAISPLLGLLGTVIGMIRVFAALMRDQAAEVAVLAGGISEALVTTAAGLTIAIPALMFHRYLLRKVDDLTVEMEHQATRFADLLHPEPQS